jgi:WD40 repeat protein
MQGSAPTVAPELKKVHQLTGHRAAVFGLTPGGHPEEFFSAAGDGWIVRWDIRHPENGQLVARIDTQAFTLLYLPEVQQMVVGNMNGGVHWVDLQEPDRTRNVAHHHKGTFSLLRIGDHVFSAGGDGMITRWSIEDRRALESFQVTNQSLRTLAFSPHRNEIAIGASDNSIFLLDAGTMTLNAHLKGAHENSVFSLCYGPAGQFLYSGGRDAKLRKWELGATPTEVQAIPAHWYTINQLVLHPTGRWMASASRDKTIRLWDLESFSPLATLDTLQAGCHVNSVNNLLWLPYQETLVSCSDDRSLILWQPANRGTGAGS